MQYMIDELEVLDDIPVIECKDHAFRLPKGYHVSLEIPAVGQRAAISHADNPTPWIPSFLLVHTDLFIHLYLDVQL